MSLKLTKIAETYKTSSYYENQAEMLDFFCDSNIHWETLLRDKYCTSMSEMDKEVTIYTLENKQRYYATNKHWHYGIIIDADGYAAAEAELELFLKDKPKSEIIYATDKGDDDVAFWLTLEQYLIICKDQPLEG